MSETQISIRVEINDVKATFEDDGGRLLKAGSRTLNYKLCMYACVCVSV